MSRRKLPDGYKNYAEWNRAMLNDLLANHGGTVEKVLAAKRGIGDFWGMFGCVVCGNDITTATARFYELNAEAMKCYDCQQREKQLTN